ncbi:MAG: monovalent cation/H+ antiporter subunit D family protein, partial [Clostridia bacterium]|nr:monovalent cation/H+ antiporter subunit D family protein [Clostridia bacterium]
MDTVFKLPFLCVIITLTASFCMPVLARWKKDFCAPLATLVAGIIFVITLVIGYYVNQGEIIRYAVSGWAPPWGIEIVVEPLSSLMLMLISGICFLILIYSFHSIKHELERKVTGWYYTAFLLCMAGMMGLVITNDIFNMYVFIEVTGISACALVAAKGTRQATEAALKYLLLATIGSGFILFGIGFLYMITGNLNLTFIAQELALVKDSYPFLLWTSLSFFVVGFGVKAALFPMHLWLPDAHSSAPSPSSAVLSSLVVKVYIIAFLKILLIAFGLKIFHETFIRHLIITLSVTAMLAGSFFAFVQIELKRRLAYSTVAQIGYIFLGIGLGTTWGLVAGILHIVVHAFMKTCLFLCAGAIYYQTGTKHVNQFAGMGYKMPITMGAFTIASFSMVGIPLFGGFISKYGLALGSLEADLPLLIPVIIISGLLNATYYFPIIGQAYFSQDENLDQTSHKGTKVFQRDQVPLSMLIPIAIFALGIIYLGIFPGVVLEFINK